MGPWSSPPHHPLSGYGEKLRGQDRRTLPMMGPFPKLPWKVNSYQWGSNHGMGWEWKYNYYFLSYHMILRCDATLEAEIEDIVGL